MHLIYGLAKGNVRAAEKLHRERYPPRDATNRCMFPNLQHSLCKYGSFRGNRDTARAFPSANPHICKLDVYKTFHTSLRAVTAQMTTRSEKTSKMSSLLQLIFMILALVGMMSIAYAHHHDGNNPFGGK
ncbi:hypothetical protein TNCV_4624451 [Trichonephila clavipes]|nr:hypothetical protein TNCV_4624451 [Trichonephila clavipes]